MNSSAPKPQHTPQPISLEEFKPGGMKPGSYSHEDITKTLVNHISRSKGDFTDRQKEGLRKFKHYGTWSFSQPDSLDELKKWFDIFNDIFFNGILTGHCTLDFYDTRYLRLGYRVRGYCTTYIPGQERDPRFLLERQRSNIAIGKITGDPSDSLLRRHPSKRIHMYMNTLLHQMVHAAFHLYVPVQAWMF